MNTFYQYYNYLSNYSQKTRETYYRNVLLYKRYLKETKGNDSIITICNADKKDIYNYIAYMDKLSKNTKKARIYAIKNFYKWLGTDLSDFLFEDIKLYDFNKKLPLVLSWSETKLLIDYYTNKRNRLLIYLLLTTGLRLAEVEQIKAEDINLEEKYIRIIGKGNIERRAYMNNHLKTMLEDYMPEKERLFNIKRGDIYYIVKKALKELDLKGSVHTLRHTAGTLMYQNTNDILLVKKFLGHKSINSTQIYTHLINDEVKEAVNRNPLAKWGV